MYMKNIFYGIAVSVLMSSCGSGLENESKTKNVCLVGTMAPYEVRITCTHDLSKDEYRCNLTKLHWIREHTVKRISSLTGSKAEKIWNEYANRTIHTIEFTKRTSGKKPSFDHTIKSSGCGPK